LFGLTVYYTRSWGENIVHGIKEFIAMTLLNGFDAIEDDHAARRSSLESIAFRLFVPFHGKLDIVDLPAGENSGSKVVRQVSDASELDEAVSYFGFLE
jgi:hypothetical protein